MKQIERILAKEYPDLEIEDTALVGDVGMSDEELTGSIRYIREKELIALALKQFHASASNGQGLRMNATEFEIDFPGQERKIIFRVEYLRPLKRYLMYINAYKHNGSLQPYAKLETQTQLLGLHNPLRYKLKK